jgi:hypothetical protein
VGVDYYIVPSLYQRNQPGEFFLSVFCENPFDLEGNVKLQIEQAPMLLPAPPSGDPVAGKPSGPSATVTTNSTHGQQKDQKDLLMTVSQFLDKKETLRSKIVTEVKRLNVSLASLNAIFTSEPGLCLSLQLLSMFTSF